MPRPEFIMELAKPQSPLPKALVYVFAEAGQGEREAAVEALFDGAGVKQALAVRRHVARALPQPRLQLIARRLLAGARVHGAHKRQVILGQLGNGGIVDTGGQDLARQAGAAAHVLLADRRAQPGGVPRAVPDKLEHVREAVDLPHRFGERVVVDSLAAAFDRQAERLFDVVAGDRSQIVAKRAGCSSCSVAVL